MGKQVLCRKLNWTQIGFCKNSENENMDFTQYVTQKKTQILCAFASLREKKLEFGSWNLEFGIWVLEFESLNFGLSPDGTRQQGKLRLQKF